MKSYLENLRASWKLLALCALVFGFMAALDFNSALGSTPVLMGLISFNLIPINIRTPGQYIEFDNTRAVQGLPAAPSKIVVIGTRLATGTVLQAVPVQILSSAQGEDFFGRGSMLAHMITAAKLANPYTEMWAVAMDENAAGVKATGTITITGPATADGTINLLIGGRQVQVAVVNGDAQNTIATNVGAAINANTDLDVTAGVAANVVTLTARSKGTYGNFIDVRQNYYLGQVTPKGVVLAFVAMAAGATNPAIGTAIAAIGNEQYQTWIVGYEDAANLTSVETELSNRWGPLVQKEGQAFIGTSGTHAAAVTFGDTRNSQFLSILNTGKSPTPWWEAAAQLAAVDAFEPDPARPRQTLALPNVLAPAPQDRYTRSERDILLNHGISTFTTDPGGTVLIERTITTYKTNAAGVTDISYLDIETMRTLAYLRFSVRTRIALRYPRCKLANDGTRFSPGQAIVTPMIIRSELCGLFREWEEAGLAEGFEQFKADLIVERNVTDPNRVDAIIPPDVINQFRVFAGKVQFRL